jgi:hypothetical protein
MNIIGFAGPAKGGKTTVANMLIARAYDNWFPISEQFAGPLKESSRLLGFRKGGSTDDLYRDFCQYAGNLGRTRCPRWFVALMEAKLNGIAEEDRISSEQDPDIWKERLIVIDDVRFENEIDLIHRFGGKVVFVDAFRRLPDLDADWRQHVSEKLAMDYGLGRLTNDTLMDFLLVNNGTEDQLEDLVDALAPLWLGEVPPEAYE